MINNDKITPIISRVLRETTIGFVGPSIGPSGRRAVTLYFFYNGLWPHCSCSDAQATTPAHPHATGEAVYPVSETVLARSVITKITVSASM